MMLNVLNYWVVGFCTAYIVGIGFGFGPAGIWFGITLALCIAGLVLVGRFYLLMKSLKMKPLVA